MIAIAVGLFEAKTHLSRYVACAERGEEVIITRHNKPVAKIEQLHARSEPVREDVPPFIQRTHDICRPARGLRDRARHGMVRWGWATTTGSSPRTAAPRARSERPSGRHNCGPGCRAAHSWRWPSSADGFWCGSDQPRPARRPENGAAALGCSRPVKPVHRRDCTDSGTALSPWIDVAAGVRPGQRLPGPAGPDSIHPRSAPGRR